jgi:N-formylglutamate deformylase
MSDGAMNLERGRIPLLVSMPHVGTAIPVPLQARLTERALAGEDTDWHLPQVYDFAAGLGATVLSAHWSRVVVDLNRPPDDAPMYPGANNTGLCPTRSFSGEALYRAGAEPDAAEVGERRRLYWEPYHEALAAELARLRAEHGRAILLDAHSIRSELPWLFEGKLPDLNLGTVGGASCDPSLRARLAAVLQSQDRYTVAIDGRFRGGYITRHHGRPTLGVHAVQLEMCWSCYMDEDPPWQVDERRAVHLRPVLEQLLATIAEWRAPA